jgi:hypothetical protein
LPEILVASAAPAESARFWSALLDRPTTARADGAPSVPLPGGTDMVFVPETEPEHAKNRLHLDLASTTGEHQSALVTRAIALGASHADIGQGGVPWVVLRDPEGNEFCVLEPRPEYLGIGPVAAVVVDTVDPPLLAAFWSKTTGLPVVREHSECISLGGESGFLLEFVRVNEAKAAGNRLRFTVAPAVGPLAACDRADPEGNEFHVRAAP